MVGDAAHSVLPPTGEGLNSGLEDCNILGQVIDDGGNDYFHRYNEVRSQLLPSGALLVPSEIRSCKEQ